LSNWSPQQYEKFKSEREQPFHDLLALVERRPHMRVVDLGCGTGELTRRLHEGLTAEETMGIDSSETMLLRSDAFGGEMLKFQQGEIESFVADRPFDLIFSNAALHWVEDHERRFARLVSFLAPHGQLAVQMPFNHDHPSQTIAAELARELDVAPRVPPLLAPDEYASLLNRLGFARQHVRLQVYGHVLPSSRDVAEWTKGTTLTEYQRKLGDRFDDFVARYTERLVEKLGDDRPYFFPFKRILLWATF
jgi:trans-aconitate 2-methyltransferase